MPFLCDFIWSCIYFSGNLDAGERLGGQATASHSMLMTCIQGQTVSLESGCSSVDQRDGCGITANSIWTGFIVQELVE